MDTFEGYRENNDDDDDDYPFDMKSHLRRKVNGYSSNVGNANNKVAEGSYIFNNLTRNTEYEVKIRAKNRFGWSENEPSFVFKTSYNGKYKLYTAAETKCIARYIFHIGCVFSVD